MRQIPPRGRTMEGPALQKYLDIIREVVNALVIGMDAESRAEASGGSTFFNNSGAATQKGYIYGYSSGGTAKAVSGASPVVPYWPATASVASGTECPFEKNAPVKVKAQSASLAFTKGAPVWLSSSVAGTVTPTEPAANGTTWYFVGTARQTTPDGSGMIEINPWIDPGGRSQF